jgi:hypothetical protein
MISRQHECKWDRFVSGWRQPAANKRRRALGVSQLFRRRMPALFEQRFARDIAVFGYRY